MSDAATIEAPAAAPVTPPAETPAPTLLSEPATTPEGATTDTPAAAADGTGSATETTEPAQPATEPVVYEFTLPEGVTLSPEQSESMQSLLRDASVAPEKAQALVDAHLAAVDAAVQAVEAQRVAEVQAWREATLAAEDIGGAKLSATLADAQRVLQALPNGPALRTVLDQTGLGNHPDVIRALAQMGRAIAEDTTVRSGSGGETTLSPEEKALRMYPSLRR